MGCHARHHQQFSVLVALDFGIGLDEFLEDLRTTVCTFSCLALVLISPDLESGFIASATCRHEDDRRKKIETAQSREQFRGRNFRHSESHRL